MTLVQTNGDCGFETVKVLPGLAPLVLADRREPPVLVAMMLQGGGFDVVDLGTDVKPQQFVEAVQREKPDFVMMSALLTTTMGSMRDTVEALKASGLRGGVRVGVGGAPVTQRFADDIGADFYASDASGAAAKARQLTTA